MWKRPSQVSNENLTHKSVFKSTATVYVEGDSALDNIQELRAEVTRQKNVLSELETVKQDTAGKRLALIELDQNVSHVSRQATRAEDKLSQLRRQGTSRSAENKFAIEQLHQQFHDAEIRRAQLKSRVDRAETDYTRMEREVELEWEAQEKVLYIN
jgi:predicted  nucleic acid-binding Zn-ribbon protein